MSERKLARVVAIDSLHPIEGVDKNEFYVYDVYDIDNQKYCCQMSVRSSLQSTD